MTSSCAENNTTVVTTSSGGGNATDGAALPQERDAFQIQKVEENKDNKNDNKQPLKEKEKDNDHETDEQRDDHAADVVVDEDLASGFDGGVMGGGGGEGEIAPTDLQANAGDDELDLDFGGVMGSFSGLPQEDGMDESEMDFGIMGAHAPLPTDNEVDTAGGFGVGGGIMGGGPCGLFSVPVPPPPSLPPPPPPSLPPPPPPSDSTADVSGAAVAELGKEGDEPAVVAATDDTSALVDSPQAQQPPELKDDSSTTLPGPILSQGKEDESVAVESPPKTKQEDASAEATEEEEATAGDGAVAATSSGNTIVDTMRKGAVAVAGGTLTAVGLVMIPLPTPCGCVVAGSGLALLGTEFEAANRVMEQVTNAAEETRDQLIESVEAAIEDDGYYATDGEITITTVQKPKPKAKSMTTASTNNTLEQQQQQQQQLGSEKSSAEGDVPDKNKGTEDKDIATAPATLEQQQMQQHKQVDGGSSDHHDDEDTSEFVISVNADSYFDPVEQRIDRERKQGGVLNNYLYNPIEYARKRFGMEKKGFLATSVLPLLQKTKQFSGGSNENAANDNTTN